jgi:hypothetical protein
VRGTQGKCEAPKVRGEATKAEAMTVLMGVTRVVRMVPLLAEFLSVFVDTLVVLSAMSCAFVFVEGVRRWVALVGGWRGPRGRVGWPSWAGGPRGRVALVGGGGGPRGRGVGQPLAV